MSLIDPVLDKLYPNKLRPVKGLLYTYFADKIEKNSDNQEIHDLQDNEVCKSMIVYLKKAFNSLGQKLYVDILFNDINSDQYFEIYSEFNLKRLMSQINDIKSKLFPANLNQSLPTCGSTGQNKTTFNDQKVPIVKVSKPRKKLDIQIDSTLASLLKKQEKEQEEHQKV